MTSSVLLFFYLSTLYLTWCDASDASLPKLSILDVNGTTEEDVTETQYATCKIATEELVASARATVRSVITGACSAKTIGKRLQSLENKLTGELREIKTILYSILQKKEDSPKSLKTSTNEKSINKNNYREDENDAPSPRQLEIDKFNSTVVTNLSVNGSTSSFFYYWQIKGFSEKLAGWKTARSERSGTFYIGQNGYAMYIKVTPSYFSNGTVFMSIGLTRGRHDSLLKWPFSHRIRLEVLDHSTEQPRLDRRSRIWDPSTLCSEYFWDRPKLTGEPDNPECVGLSVPRKILFSKIFSIDRASRHTRYLWNGTITIQLTVFL
ncbi:uncharacterized protein LOC122394782 [Colletes gigas]|uniref:uncharacterized protein LOC122394782 n=1 Tax=Colletes gigas TaxID=935657 RepID=UPI001C9AD0A5|nr:uncharacterized protein LOC122394782 [Colletes gigas]